VKRIRLGVGQGPNATGSIVRRSIGIGATLVLLVVAATACGSAQNKGDAAGSGVVNSTTASALKAEGPLNIIDNTYSSQPIQAALLAKVIDEFGGETKVTQMADLAAGWKFMAQTPNVVYPEMPVGLYQNQFKQYVDDEKTAVALTSSTKGSEGWYVPTYVIKGDPARGIKPACPGLPDWKALNECVDVFKTARTGDKGQYMMGEKAWAATYGDDNRIANLGLNYEMVYAGSEAALMAEWKRAYEAGQPFLGLLWTPTYTALKYDVTKVDFPPYSKECWDTTSACNWPDQDIRNIVSAKVETDHPLAFQIVKNYNPSDDQLRKMMLMVNDDGMTPQQAVDKWFGENKAIWEKWAPTPAAS
jgi:glycine betaine/proline transport system substrate-binding protein